MFRNHLTLSTEYFVTLQEWENIRSLCETLTKCREETTRKIGSDILRLAEPYEDGNKAGQKTPEKIISFVLHKKEAEEFEDLVLTNHFLDPGKTSETDNPDLWNVIQEALKLMIRDSPDEAETKSLLEPLKSCDPEQTIALAKLFIRIEKAICQRMTEHKKNLATLYESLNQTKQYTINLQTYNTKTKS